MRTKSVAWAVAALAAVLPRGVLERWLGARRHVRLTPVASGAGAIKTGLKIAVIPKAINNPYFDAAYVGAQKACDGDRRDLRPGRPDRGHRRRPGRVHQHRRSSRVRRHRHLGRGRRTPSCPP